MNFPHYISVCHDWELHPRIDYTNMGLSTIHWHRFGNYNKKHHGVIIAIPFEHNVFNYHELMNALYQTLAYFDDEYPNDYYTEAILRIIDYVNEENERLDDALTFWLPTVDKYERYVEYDWIYPIEGSIPKMVLQLTIGEKLEDYEI